MRLIKVDTNTQAPGGLGSFTNFLNPSFDESENFVVFWASTTLATFAGIYLLDRSTGNITTIADETLYTCISIYTIVVFVECLFTGKGIKKNKSRVCGVSKGYNAKIP